MRISLIWLAFVASVCAQADQLDVTPSASSSASVNDTCQQLGHAFSYAILAYSTITNTGPSVITGNVGIHPDDLSSITGFPPGIITGTVNAANAPALLAKNSLNTAIMRLVSISVDLFLVPEYTALIPPLQSREFSPWMPREIQMHFSSSKSVAR